jgi:hypothetical protein
MLALVASRHIHWLLDQVEVEVLIAERWSKVEVAVDKGLRTRIEESVDIRLVPTRLFDGLKLAVEIV